MPSSSKVSGSLCLCALAYILSELAKPQFIEDFNFGYFTYVSMLVGVIIRWVLMGKRAGFGLVSASQQRCDFDIFDGFGCDLYSKRE